MLDGVCAHRTYAKQGFSWWGITAELHKEDIEKNLRLWGNQLLYWIFLNMKNSNMHKTYYNKCYVENCCNFLNYAYL